MKFPWHVWMGRRPGVLRRVGARGAVIVLLILLLARLTYGAEVEVLGPTTHEAATAPAPIATGVSSAATMAAGTSDPDDEVGPLLLIVLMVLLVLAVAALAVVALGAMAAGVLLLLLLLGILSTSAIAGTARRSWGTAARWLVIQLAAVAGAIVGAIAALGVAVIVTTGLPWWVLVIGGMLSGGLSGALVGWLLQKAVGGIVRAVQQRRAIRRGQNLPGHFPVEKP